MYYPNLNSEFQGKGVFCKTIWAKRQAQCLVTDLAIGAPWRYQNSEGGREKGVERGGRELQVHFAFSKVAKWKKSAFLFCFCSLKLQRVEGKQSSRVGVKFLIETVLKPQNTMLSKVIVKQLIIFKRKSLQLVYQNLFCISFIEEFNVYFDKTNSCVTV